MAKFMDTLLEAIVGRGQLLPLTPVEILLTATGLYQRYERSQINKQVKKCRERLESEGLIASEGNTVLESPETTVYARQTSQGEFLASRISCFQLTTIWKAPSLLGHVPHIVVQAVKSSSQQSVATPLISLPSKRSS